VQRDGEFEFEFIMGKVVMLFMKKCLASLLKCFLPSILQNICHHQFPWFFTKKKKKSSIVAGASHTLEDYEQRNKD
jgi:hypothetical protein